MKTLHSLWAAKFNKNDLKNWQDLKETRERLAKFQFKFGYVEEQLFVLFPLSSIKMALLW